MKIELATITGLAMMTTQGFSAIALTTDSVGGTLAGTAEFTLGYVFNLSTDSLVTSLGMFDVAGDGFDASTVVALYNWDTGAKITETTLLGASRVETGVYDTDFVAISPVALVAGTNYLIAGESISGDYAFSSNAAVSIISLDPSVTLVEGRATPLGNPAVPATANTTSFSIVRGNSYYGPNFEVQAVPEPSSLGLLALATLASISRRRRS